MTVRAKFRCTSIERFGTSEAEGPVNYRFAPVYDQSIPEDQRYAKFTPSGELRLYVDNPAVSFEAGKAYYLDIAPAEVEVPAPAVPSA